MKKNQNNTYRVLDCNGKDKFTKFGILMRSHYTLRITFDAK